MESEDNDIWKDDSEIDLQSLRERDLNDIIKKIEDVNE